MDAATTLRAERLSEGAAASLWNTKSQQTGANLYRLLMIGVRRLASQEAEQPWRILVPAILRAVSLALGPETPAKQRADLIQLLLKTDLFQCVSRVLARVPSAGPIPAARNLRALTRAVAKLLELLISSAAFDFQLMGNPVSAKLVDKLLQSGIVEHLARALLLLAGPGAASAAAGPGPSGARVGPAAGPGWQDLEAATVDLCEVMAVGVMACKMDRPDAKRLGSGLLKGPCLQHFMLVHLLSQLHALDGAATHGLAPAALLPPARSTPVPQTPASEEIAAAVGADTVADGKTLNASYSRSAVSWWMHLVSLTPPTSTASKSRGGASTSSARAGTSGASAGAAAGAGGSCRSRSDSWRPWGENARLPVSAAALQVLCLRLASAAAWCLETQPRTQARAFLSEFGFGLNLPAPPPPAPSPPLPPLPPAAFRGSPPAREPLSRPEALALLFQCLNAALAASNPPAPADGSEDDYGTHCPARYWGAALRGVRALAAEGPDATVSLQLWSGSKCDARALLDLVRPRLPVLDLPLPLRPHPALAAALDSGYVPFMEALLRRHHGPSAEEAAWAVADVFAAFPRLVGLYAHADPAPLASFLATGAKLLLKAVSGIKPSAAPGASDAIVQVLSNAAEWVAGDNVVLGLVDVVPKVAEAPAAGKRSRGRPQSGGGGSGGGGGAGQTDALLKPGWWLEAAQGGASGAGEGGSGSGSAGAEVLADLASSPHRRFLTLATFTLSRWLPALARLAHRMLDMAVITCPPGGAGGVSMQACTFAYSHALPILKWIPVLAIAACPPPGVPTPAAEAATWRRLLLEEVGAWRLVSRLGRVLAATPPSKRPHGYVDVFGPAFMALSNLDAYSDIVAALGRVGEPADAPLGPVNEHRFDMVMAEAIDPRNNLDRKIMVELTLCMRAQPSYGPHCAPAISQALERAGLGWAPLAAGLLPPPGVVSRALKLPPRCSYPGCCTLDGDSEAGAGQLSRCQGRCGGAVAYCGRACQKADWGEGHKAKCGK
ncbi:hypothetical protein HYH03_010598 [Edaphochlamys debaryana]|uniref:phytol kinase n=1 Tax=Edaphochlamys debaryana TaxID=47281 RepID=A0A836BXF0_9CHLO|nr:hypothetical protein HYH03_010598 [Edaphochlamys debaryana]|eukprot:KAG2491158.1 hypothetical protein HYH03_010598 [Edaphochlamys debaryana]